MEQVRSGRADVSAIFDAPSRAVPGFLLSWRALRENQIRVLETNTRLVELARRPPEEQGPALLQSRDEYFRRWDQASLLQRFNVLTSHELLTESFIVGGWQARHRAHLHLAILALAGERFRLDRGRWPDSADEMVTSYLAAVPYDPYGAGPLKSKRDGQGMTFYSVGENRKDDGGTIVRGDPYSRVDLGFRLDDTEARPR